jgi:hypothetical protein
MEKEYNDDDCQTTCHNQNNENIPNSKILTLIWISKTIQKPINQRNNIR